MRRGYVTFTLIAAMVAASCVSARSEGADGPQLPRAAGKPGLLVIAHGAPVEKSNRLVLGMEPLIARALGKENPFGAVEIAFMEFARPTVARKEPIKDPGDTMPIVYIVAQRR